ncbi:hypothetical protein SEUCBS139899_004642 [Sporothrix eucalyptigena]
MTDVADPESPVLALRAAFGDRKPPDISRKITACVACRKQKIKCHMVDGQAPWKYAMEKKMRQLEAIVASVAKDTLSANTLQLIQENQTNNQAGPSIIDKNVHEENHENNEDRGPHQTLGEEPPQSDADHRNGDQGANHWEIVMDLESGPGAMPGFYISDRPPPGRGAGDNSNHTSHDAMSGAQQQVATNTAGTNTNQGTRNNTRPVDHSTRDFIARGVVSLEHAQAYFDNYHNRMDHFPYRILCDHGPVSLTRLRTTSPLLVAAVCSVGALHTYDHAGGVSDFNKLHAEFVALCSRKAISKACTMDDVRGLCIGALWLGGDLSWSLVGAAVRMATELQLHRSFRRALVEDEADGADTERRLHYLRTRLWYLVYACDHHFSVVYGRLPLTREDESVREARLFVTGPHATEDDARLVSQVLRWSLCSNIFDTFGVDVTRSLTDAEVPHLRRFGLALDGLRAEWVDKFRPNPHVGNYPRKGVMLQYNFAKLYLYSHAFRGVREGGQREYGNTPTVAISHAPTVTSPAAASSTLSSDSSMDLDEAANAGVLAALSILRTVVSDTEIQSYLDGLPIYFDVMIAFAAVFLLKVASKFSASVLINVEEIKSLVVTLVARLKRVTQTMHPRHLLSSITKGIEGLLYRSGLVDEEAGARQSNEQSAAVEFQGAILNEGQDSMKVVDAMGATVADDVGQATREANEATAQFMMDHSGDTMLTSDQDWLGHTEPGPYFMGEYDFLMNQDMDFDMQFMTGTQ